MRCANTNQTKQASFEDTLRELIRGEIRRLVRVDALDLLADDSRDDDLLRERASEVAARIRRARGVDT
jgi:hypothetical protein